MKQISSTITSQLTTSAVVQCATFLGSRFHAFEWK